MVSNKRQIEERIEKAQQAIVNAVHCLKENCPQNYNKLVKEAFDNCNVNEEMQLILKRKRTVVEELNCKNENKRPRIKVEEVEEKVKVETVERELEKKKEEDDGFELIAFKMKEAMKNIDSQRGTDIEIPSNFPNLDMSLIAIGKSCIDYVDRIKKAEKDGEDACVKAFWTFEKSSRLRLYRFKSAGSFMNTMLQLKFGGAKLGLLVALAVGVNEIKKINCDNVRKLVLLLVEHKDDDFFIKMSEFQMSESIQTIMIAANYL